LRPISSVIFDLDGTLVDSEPNYRLSDERFLIDRGIELPENVWESFVGIGSERMIERVQEEHGLQGDLQELLARKDAYYHEIARTGTELFPGTIPLLNGLAERDMPVAVATGSSSATMALILEVTGLEDYISLAVSSDEVPRSKPAPDVFLEAARRLGVPAQECLVLEDSLSGVQAAQAGGMRVVALPTVPAILDEPELREAEMVFPGGAGELDTEAVLRYIDSRKRKEGRAAG